MKVWAILHDEPGITFYSLLGLKIFKHSAIQEIKSIIKERKDSTGWSRATPIEWRNGDERIYLEEVKVEK